MQKVYKKRIKDVDELRQRILTAWDELDQRVIDTAVRQWRTRLLASRRKADTLNTKLASSFRQLLVGHRYFILVNDFNVYQRLLLIFVAVSVRELIFCPAVFYTVCAGNHLKDMMVNLASPDVLQVTNVYA